MKNTLKFIILTLIIVSCNKEFDNAMKSADKDVILKAANKYYEKKNWKEALELYDRLPNLLAGTDELADMSFKQAFANYYDRSYKLAAYQFKSFTVNNPRDPRREEASYMSAICYYQDSRDYNLDQESTVSAINELQEFLNEYPNSDRSKNILKFLDELSYKLEFKAFESARQYYKMAEYKAADIAFENVLEDYPSTRLRPQIYSYMMKSKERLAVLSNFELKADRIENAIAFTKLVEREYPNTDNSKEAIKLRASLEEERVKFEKLIVEYNKKKAEKEDKIKKLSSEQVSNMQKKADNRRKIKDIKEFKNKIERLKRDSAILNMHPPGATFKIPRK